MSAFIALCRQPRAADSRPTPPQVAGVTASRATAGRQFLIRLLHALSTWAA
jgi:hypothetical protein